ncbi:MAG: hypothetical protein Q9167_002365 [Letrouitia subvulpina]
MATCLLQNIDDYDKADMQSATIILGLMPTILSYVGPTVGEMALVSSRRPVLAVLVMLGAPAVYATRPFAYISPADSLEKDVGNNFVLHKQTPLRAAMMTIAQYLFLSLAVTNCLLNSVQLGTSTILSWKCQCVIVQSPMRTIDVKEDYSLPFLVIFVDWKEVILLTPINLQTSRRLNQKSTPKGNPSGVLMRWLWNEANPSANHAKPEFNIGTPEARIAVCLNWIAVILAYAHWIFGTLVFSSTLFIGTLDALGVIARYLASALICRTILLIELAGIRGAVEAETLEK